MSVSLARRLALLEAKLAALRSKKDVRVELKDFAQPAPAAARTDDPVVDAGANVKMFDCPSPGCDGRVQQGARQCSACLEPLAWTRSGE